jgi:DNA-binding response OmpR family regulator
MRVLIVEDDLPTLHLEGQFVESYGHEVFKASSVEEAIDLLQSALPDLILLDLLMNGELSTPLIQVARDMLSHRTPRIVIISANTLAKGVAERHHVEFLAKPFDIESLEKIVDEKEKAPDSEESRAYI